jgi:hypothetical protein
VDAEIQEYCASIANDADQYIAELLELKQSLAQYETGDVIDPYSTPAQMVA